jgi:hypothetical protein
MELHWSRSSLVTFGQLSSFMITVLISVKDDSKCLRFIFNVLHEDMLASTAHFWVPRPAPKSLSVEDIAFLKAKGSFILPPEELLEELIHCYFDYVHPLLPVLDPASFLCRYEAEGPSGVSLLLLQTILFAASNVSFVNMLFAACVDVFYSLLIPKSWRAPEFLR